MSQGQRAKRPLDVLQSMINAILIETGRALRAADKDSEKTMGPGNARLRSTIPSMVENFHQALDDLECDIIRAKAVLGRDLEQVRTQRQAAEQSTIQTTEDATHPSSLKPPAPEPLPIPVAIMATSKPSPEVTVKEEKIISSPSPPPPPASQAEKQPTPEDPAKEAILEDKKEEKLPTPQNLEGQPQSSEPASLNIDTKAEADTQNHAPSTGAIPDSSIDSLFGDMGDLGGMTGNNNESANVDLNFDDMDFTISNANGESQDTTQNQTQSQEFDLSTFGDNVGQDMSLNFNMTDIQSSTQPLNGNNNATITTNKQDDLSDLFGPDNTAGGDNMDLDLAMDVGGGDDNAFDDMFFGTGDDTAVGSGGMVEMEHGEFDNAFFGIGD